MNITSNDLLDSLMRVALRPEMIGTYDMNGNRTGTYAEPGIMQPIVNAIADQMRNDEELKSAILRQVIELVPEMVPFIQDRLLNYVVQEHVITGQYGSGSHKKAVIATWAEPQIQTALLEALRDRVMEQIPRDLPLENYDISITVNMAPK